MTSRTYWILGVAAAICVVVILAVKLRRDTSDVGEPGADETVKHVTTKDGTGSIQSAIDDATDGDVIEVVAGTHYESIDFNGKPITVRSSDPNDWEVVQKTVIDANSEDTVVDFHNSEGADSVLKGFKITGGETRGISCSGASPTIGNCLITHNGREGSSFGGGMCNRAGASPSVTNCVFNKNRAEIGGGMCNRAGASPTVTNCVFFGNEVEGDDGGGMYNDESSPTIINCTFCQNESEDDRGGAIYNRRNSNAKISNCIFWFNDAERAGDEIYNDGSKPTFSYCCIRGGLNGSRCGGDDSVDGGGNISDNPGFYSNSNPAGADRIWGTSDDSLRLAGDSPCIDAGDNIAISEPGDIAGNTRKLDAPNATDTGNGTAPTVDMGAYEYNPGP
jgi:predicted outer membrane repeat protein